MVLNVCWILPVLVPHLSRLLLCALLKTLFWAIIHSVQTSRLDSSCPRVCLCVCCGAGVGGNCYCGTDSINVIRIYYKYLWYVMKGGLLRLWFLYFHRNSLQCLGYLVIFASAYELLLHLRVLAVLRSQWSFKAGFSEWVRQSGWTHVWQKKEDKYSIPPL